METVDKVKALADMAKMLNEWDIISIAGYGVHCRDKFFVDNFEPESIEDTGKYVTATAHANDMTFYALFALDRGDIKEGYRLAAEKLRAA